MAVNGQTKEAHSLKAEMMAVLGISIETKLQGELEGINPFVFQNDADVQNGLELKDAVKFYVSASDSWQVYLRCNSARHDSIQSSEFRFKSNQGDYAKVEGADQLLGHQKPVVGSKDVQVMTGHYHVKPGNSLSPSRLNLIYTVTSP